MFKMRFIVQAKISIKHFLSLEIWRATRPSTLQLTLAPFFVGIILGLQESNWHWGRFGLCLVGIISLHFAAFVYNELFDYLSGVDQLAVDSPKSFVSTPGTLISGRCSVFEIRAFAFLWLFLAAVCAAILLLVHNYMVGIVFALGIFLAYFYTAPPIELAYHGHGLGELAALLGFGILPTLAAYYSLETNLTIKPILYPVPMGLLAVALLIEHDYLHWETDKIAKKFTPVVVLGTKNAWLVLECVIVAVYVSLIWMVKNELLSPWLLLLLLTKIPMLFAWLKIRMMPSIENYKNLILLTSQVHLMTFLGVVLSLVRATDELQ